MRALIGTVVVSLWWPLLSHVQPLSQALGRPSQRRGRVVLLPRGHAASIRSSSSSFVGAPTVAVSFAHAASIIAQLQTTTCE